MQYQSVLFAVCSAVAVLFPLPTRAQPVDESANLNFHLTDIGGCGTFQDGDYPTCDDLGSSPQPGQAQIWVVASRQGQFPMGIGGVQFAVVHSGLDVLLWVNCTGGLEIPTPTWPASGSSIAITWSGGCYHSPTEVAKVGYFLVLDGAIGAISFADPPPTWGGVKYATCAPQPIQFVICLPNTGAADLSVGIAPVCGPHCGTTPAESVSWSRVKGLFR